MRFPGNKDQALWMYMLVLLLILVGFFMPVSAKTWAGFGLKTGLFITVFFILYFFWFNMFFTNPQRKRTQPEQEIPEKDAPFEDMREPSWKGFGQAFHWFYQTFISIVRNATAASAVGLYLRKGETLELQIAESESSGSYPRILVQEGSLVDYVIQQNGSVRENNLPIGTCLSGIDDHEIRSFAGVPLVIDKKITGVLAAGSEAQEHFSEDDLELLNHCGQVICQVMSVYHRAWRKEIQETLWQTQLEMEQELRKAEDEMQAFNVFVQFVLRLFTFDRCVLCYKDREEGEIRQIFGQIDHLDRGTRFPLDEGLIGWVIKRNSPLVVEDMQKGSYVRPRYFEGEDTKHGFHSLLAVPLGHQDAWGCIGIESKRIGQFQEREKNGLLTMLLFFELTLERFRLAKRNLNE
ncbi:GAF domain-containing protein [bacterium]|nr:GAF domain-containing protein [bacterium]